MHRRRIIGISLVFVIAFSAIVARLLQIQVLATRSFSVGKADLIKLAYEAQSREVLLQSGRGKIIDRKGRVLVGENQERVLLFPQSKKQLRLRQDDYFRLAAILHYPRQRLLHIIDRLEYPMILGQPTGEGLVIQPQQKKQIQALHLPGVLVIQSDNRLAYPQAGRDVIGRVIRNPFLLREQYKRELASGQYSLQTKIGYTGLEEAFEPFLHGFQERVLSYLRTRKGQPLTGAKLKMIAHHEKKKSTPLHLVTTLDLSLQSQIEEILRKHHVAKGAVVVQEIQTGDILSMVSRSTQEKGPWHNQALMEATPGSIFKTVIAAAALEEKLVQPETPFYCRGKLGKYHLHDEKKEGHGQETFQQAYAQSCNVMMARLAEKVGGETLVRYAQQWGLGKPILWSGQVLNRPIKHLLHEQSGVIFADPKKQKDAGAVAQTGIGQHDVKMTPLQAVNMVTALFHQGRALSPRLVTELRTDTGKVAFRFPQKYLLGSKRLRPETVRAVQDMMSLVVKEGTASSLSNKPWQLAGKTGTAQVGVNKDRYHKWMIGFGPTQEPRYSVAVLLKDVSNDQDRRAKEIFAQVMECLRQAEAKEKN
jgi:cell division protein FtsI/penicillin-binding protein 2